MNNQILNDQTAVYYAICVNGVIISQKYDSKMIAETEKTKLPIETQAVAEVVPMTADGKQLLLG